ncbi:MAG TPA: CBS domain-containing protein [Alphaproteobacteria bacterium]|nr:CBS domain-containing protein [Alphaproteobacteria bacterium]USO04756.1 MAG: CBS domain-containing protein [Rhodospirillales bacterium]HOO81268.1 CBS domain-containing protein [Alphaproteobacteria bacterium]
MPCNDAMIEDVVTARPNQTVSEVLELFSKYNIRSVPIVDENRSVVGLFSFSHLLYSLLPVPATLGDHMMRLKHMDISLDHLLGASPWVAKRLNIILPKTMEEVMLKNPVCVRVDSPIREGIRLMVKYDSPLPVVEDEKNRKLVGLISSQSVLGVLTEIASHLEKGKEVHE